MNSIHFEHSSDHEYPATELDMKNVLEQLSAEYNSNKSEKKYHGVLTNQRIIDYKVEDCTNLGDISSISRTGQERQEKVRKFKIEFVVIYDERLWKTLSYVVG